MSFLGFANYYREFIKGYADKVYPMQQLMRHKSKKFARNNAQEESKEKGVVRSTRSGDAHGKRNVRARHGYIGGKEKKELCEAPGLGMPTEKGMYVLDTDTSVVAISGIIHQEQE